MRDVVIQADNIYKKYNLGVIGYGSLRADIQSWWAKKNGKEDPNSPIDGAIQQERADSFWALQDVSFTVQQGEVLGIIGHNGAGKSTLLKILSRLTAPTRGELRIKGKVASLLEVGTGFHPELTGRENVYLNGAILGMTRQEVSRKFDEIVSFSGVEKFIDTPVKRYSSGMYVRLAFAVGAHLDSEILIVDEVLAVGDAQFQKKCLNKIKDMQKQGRTILFVSHSSSMISSLCNHCLWLIDGSVKMYGIADQVAKAYAGADLSEPIKTDNRQLPFKDLSMFDNKFGDNEISVASIELLNPVSNTFCINADEPIILKILAKANKKVSSAAFVVGLSNFDDMQIVTVRSSDSGLVQDISAGSQLEVIVRIHHNLRSGSFNLQLGVSSQETVYYYNPSVATLEIRLSKYQTINNFGIIDCKSDWVFSS